MQYFRLTSGFFLCFFSAAIFIMLIFIKKIRFVICFSRYVLSLLQRVFFLLTDERSLCALRSFSLYFLSPHFSTSFRLTPRLLCHFPPTIYHGNSYFLCNRSRFSHFCFLYCVPNNICVNDDADKCLFSSETLCHCALSGLFVKMNEQIYIAIQQIYSKSGNSLSGM